MAKKRADGRMQKAFTVNGKKYVVYGHSTKELFEKELAKREEIEKGLEKRNNPTVSEYYERWTEARRGTVSDATLRAQGKMFHAFKAVKIPSANRTFGELKLKEVSIDDLRVLQTELKKGEVRKDGTRKERKTQTVNDYLAHIKHFMNDALKERVIDYNPCVLLKPLKRTEEKARNTGHRALSLEEQKKFFECERCKKSYYYNVFRFAISTGMRIGEIGALKNSDIRGGMIHIERTITRTETGSHIMGENAKTEAGRRTIPMNEQIKAILADQKAINSMLDGNVVSMDDRIFKAPERGLLLAMPTDREIIRICKAAGIEPFSMHAFRATFATRAIENGMNMKTLQEIMGHSNFNITMSLYGHCLTDTKQAAMDTMVLAL
ncbi:MAG: site-specific integrase [Lachnospiraceae bacterium]|nr:site-specific integrase [Lachnospiraceae bacterium]